MLQRISYVTSIAFAITALAACGAQNHAGSAVPNRASSASNRSAADVQHEALRVQHGAELEAGVPFMVTDGNSHVMFPGSAVVSRSKQGLSVVSGRHTRFFPASAVVSQSGEYHHYAPVTP